MYVAPLFNTWRGNEENQVLFFTVPLGRTVEWSSWFLLWWLELYSLSKTIAPNHIFGMGLKHTVPPSTLIHEHGGAGLKASLCCVQQLAASPNRMNRSLALPAPRFMLVKSPPQPGDFWVPAGPVVERRWLGRSSFQCWCKASRHGSTEAAWTPKRPNWFQMARDISYMSFSSRMVYFLICFEASCGCRLGQTCFFFP